MTILDLITCPHGMKPNHELNSLLNSSKPSMKTHKKSIINKQAIKKNINWLTNESKAIKKIPIEKHFKLDLQWDLNETNNLELSDNKKSVCFHSECASCFETNGVRSNKPLKRNALTYWEITLLNKNLNGTSLMIGVGTKQASLNKTGYLNLIGSDQSSWGLTHTGMIWHANQSTKFCDSFQTSNNNNNDTITTIGCLYDGYNGQLSFYKNGIFLGIAFNNLFDEIYPMCSSTVTQSVFRMDVCYQSFPSLEELCVQQVLKNKIDYNGLPKSIVHYLNRN